MGENGFVVIDGNEVDFRAGETVLAAARRVGVEVPTLCHDDRLEPAGACRMCLVEVEGERRLAPACARKAEPGMVVRTGTSRVERHRRFLLGLYLADNVDAATAAADPMPSTLHALVDAHGAAGPWPAVASPRAERPGDENPFITFRADRCISCMLCVRYCDEVEGVSAITMAGRGAATTVSTADGLSLPDSVCELCGGCVTVCPTGAMADRPALDWGRPQAELEPVRTTCNFCGVGCQLDLLVDREADRVVAVKAPPPGETVNDGNLCVKGRFANDFIHHAERLTTPLVRDAAGELVPASWDEALDRVVAGLQGVVGRHGADALAFISSSRCTGEENYLVQKMARAAFDTHNVHQCAAT